LTYFNRLFFRQDIKNIDLARRMPEHSDFFICPTSKDFLTLPEEKRKIAIVWPSIRKEMAESLSGK